MNELNKKRGWCKAYITRAFENVKSVAENQPVELLKNKLEKLEDNYNDFVKYSKALYEFSEEKNFVDPESDVAVYEEKYFYTHAALYRAMKGSGEDAGSETQSPADETLAKLAAQQTKFLEQFCNAKVDAEVKFEKIKIPPFSGNYEDWPSFRDLFRSSIESKSGLSSTQKFHYLKSYLKGDALSLIKHIAITDKNYHEAWERLEQRYEKEQLIIRAFVQNFLNLPHTNSSNVSVLRKIVDGADESIRGLNALDCTQRDPFIIVILLNKVDNDTKQAWAEKCTTETEITFDGFLQFLNERCDALESLQLPRSVPSRRVVAVNHASVDDKKGEKKCFHCQGHHSISACDQFKALGIDERRRLAKANNLCFNCLSQNHRVLQCNSTFRCRSCKGKHHSLLHSDQPARVSATSSQQQSHDNLQADVSHSTLSSTTTMSHHCQEISLHATTRTILPTIIANVFDAYGNKTTCRMLLDSGSTATFVAESFVQRTGLQRQNARIAVVGLSANPVGVTRGRVQIHLHSRVSATSMKLSALVMGKLTSTIPAQEIDVSSTAWTRVIQLELADPSFNVPGQIDVIVGSDQLWSIYTGDRMFFGNEYVIALNSIFGWVIAGSSKTTSDELQATYAHHADLDVDNLVRSFMEMDTVQPSESKINNADPTEKHFQLTHSRGQDGTYVVEYPFKETSPPIDATLPQAVKRFEYLERKFRNDSGLKQQYVKFLDEYLALGHMEAVNEQSKGLHKSKCFYLAHHAVLKPESSSTKCRVVFDGSCKDETGVSLNERLHIGPPIQRDLLGVYLRFRQHRYVFSTDIEKMFRGIKVTLPHSDFQRIVWRKNEGEPLQHYRLRTVTYGLSPSPFLAVRVLKQIALDYASTHPKAARVLANDVYVDDIPTGCDTIEELLALKTELIDLLSKGNFQLRKWCSNCWAFLETLPQEVCEFETVKLKTLPDEAKVKILGLQWNPSRDDLSLRITSTPSTRKPTKRMVLSELSKIFDPLGIAAPVVVSLKILFQETWLHTLGWDDDLPDNLCTKWYTYMNDMSLLAKISIPRYIASPSTAIELHAFSDASLVACAAVVYSRVKTEKGYITHLIASKTRVAPMKAISIPRLELNAALLLSKLLNLITSALTIPISRIYCWTDSEIVLHWLSSSPRKWNTFVCNRTAEILDKYPRNLWHHVKSEQNPADCASRGELPSKLVHNELWWFGPTWLSSPDDCWPGSTLIDSFASDPNVIAESKTKQENVLHAEHQDNVLGVLIAKVSSWNRITRVVSYCLRFIRLCRLGRAATALRSSTPLPLSSSELQSGRSVVFRYVQGVSFSDDIQNLQRNRQLHAKSRLLQLTPFVDRVGLLRVGGRIKHANVAYNVKHPIILPKDSPISLLIIRHLHELYLHPGVDSTFVIVRQHYWILGCRNLVRRVVFRCKKCFMQRRAASVQLMGDLPAHRVQSHRPFLHCGLDYAGPVSIKLSKGRSPKFGKAYFAIFVCLSTKALHIELVSDLSTDTFIAALRRFVSIRGKPTDIYSDNGTNFQGSRRVLNEMQQLAIKQSQDEYIACALAADGITWHFIPPSAPHFGGVWEANVKSIKLHLRRVIGSNVLNFEEYQTLLSQISAVLNSRPLCVPTDDQQDALTPAHFLIGETYTAIPEPSMLNANPNHLRRWQQVQAKFSGFWKRWHMEYLTSLQQRKKWQTEHQNITCGTVVVLKEPNLPPSKWIIGRIQEVFPGNDNKVRVVTVKTSRGLYKRPITKVVVLPLY